MEYKIQLIDHTASEVLKRESDYLDHTTVFSTLAKYPIKMYDIDFNECCAARRSIFPYYFRLVTNPDFLHLVIAEKLGFDTIVINWDDGNNFNKLKCALKYCRQFAFNIHIRISNASAADSRNFSIYCKLIEEYNIRSLIFCDSDAVLNPFTVVEKLTEFKNSFSCEIEFQANDEIGLASANSMAAIRCGIEKIHTAVGGIDPSKTTAMEEILLINNYFIENAVKCDTSNMATDCTKILKALGYNVSVNKAIIGGNIFAHESGIHVDGIMKNTTIYEIFRPEEVGLHRKVVIGKHSGKASIRAKLSEYGLSLSDEELPKFLILAKRIAISQKKSLSENQFIELYNNYSKSDNILLENSNLIFYQIAT